MFGPLAPPEERESDETVVKARPDMPNTLVNTLKGHKGPVYVARFNRGGDYCLSGGQDRTIRLWNPETGLQIKDYSGEHGYEVLDLIPNDDNSKFASCGGDRVALVWDVSTGKVLRRFRGHENKINCLDYNEDCSVLITGSYDMTIKCWDLRSNMRDPIQTINKFKDSVTSLLFDDACIFACSMDGTFRCFDVRQGQLITNYVSHGLTSISISADHNCVLVSCLDSCVRLFDRATGELLNTYKGHVHQDYALGSCLSNSDAYVIGGSEDKIIRVWTLVEGTVANELHGHQGAVCCLDYHPKPSKVGLLSASFDGTVKFWK